MPLWEAMLGGHEAIAKLLIDNDARISIGDVGQFSIIAVEQSNLSLLKEIVRHGGDVTCPNSRESTALHAAVSEDNLEMVKFLLAQGANIDKPDMHGWTPRHLADQQDHVEIKQLFESHEKPKVEVVIATPKKVQVQHRIRFLERFTSEPTIRPASQDGSMEGSWSHHHQQIRSKQRITNNFGNSLFGAISAAARNGENGLILPINNNNEAIRPRNSANRPRVTISCPEKGDRTIKLVLLPGSLQELLEVAGTKFGTVPKKILTKEGAEIDDIDVIRDGDHLVLSSDSGRTNTIREQGIGL